MIRSYSFQNSRAFPMACATFETTAQKTLGTLACSAIYDSFSWNASLATRFRQFVGGATRIYINNGVAACLHVPLYFLCIGIRWALSPVPKITKKGVFPSRLAVHRQTWRLNGNSVTHESVPMSHVWGTFVQYQHCARHCFSGNFGRTLWLWLFCYMAD